MVIQNLTGPPEFPLGMNTAGMSSLVQTNPLFLPQTAKKTLWTIKGGPIQVDMIFGVCTTLIGAVANATKLTAHVTVAGADVATDICATVDINAMTVNSIYELVTGFSTAAVIGTAGVYPIASATLYTRFVMLPGFIEVNCAGSDGGTGQIQWYMRYAPLTLGAINNGGIVITMPTT